MGNLLQITRIVHKAKVVDMVAQVLARIAERTFSRERLLKAIDIMRDAEVEVRDGASYQVWFGNNVKRAKDVGKTVDLKLVFILQVPSPGGTAQDD
jgi:hypothetical protein